jgi:hypothetical protein
VFFKAVSRAMTGAIVERPRERFGDEPGSSRTG